jgi:hypothetical protein
MSEPVSLRERQASYDSAHFDSRTWQLEKWRDQKTRHILLHIAKASLKLSNFTTWDFSKVSEELERGVREEVIPDLSIYQAQLLNTHEIDNEKMQGYCDEKQPNLIRLEEAEALPHLARATGELANYLEPSEHGEPVHSRLREDRVMAAVSELHIATEGLAMAWNVDVATLHLERIERLSGNKDYMGSHRFAAPPYQYPPGFLLIDR